MKRHIMMIAILLAVLAAFHPVPRVDADPLTIMAIAGLVTVFSAGSVDMVVTHYDENRDMRAQDEKSEKLLARTEKSAEASGSMEVEAAVQR
jgi:hypothetical protein